MPSNAKVKLIRSLRFKKYRKQNNCFIAEGPKLVNELINSELKILSIYALESWIIKQSARLIDPTIIEPVTENELIKISNLKTPNKVLAVVQIPNPNINDVQLHSSFSLALSDIRDPGNMGTIIRTADWFGIKRIFLSETCADPYNSKVIQASMGSIGRVDLISISFTKLFETHPSIPVLAGTLTGKNLYQQELPGSGFILIGNESSGIEKSLTPYITNPVTIPSFGGAESLNAAVATGIICSYVKMNHED